MTQSVLNQSFRDWAANRNFPFTDGSDLTCSDGRRLPVSAFVYISVFPDIEDDARLVTIDDQNITIQVGTNWFTTASFEELLNDWIPLKHNGSVVGSIMVNSADIAYIQGMARTKTLEFNERHADIRPELVRGFCLDSEILLPPPTFFSLPSTNMTYSLDSQRYTDNIVDVDMDVSVTYTPGVTAITKIKVNGTEYSLPDDGHVLLRTPIWCDTQFISNDNKITFHQRGA